MHRLILTLVILVASHAAIAQGAAPLLLREPTLSQTHIVFSFAGDLWRVPREGGEAVRLTTGVGTETAPHFSPDGKSIAFTGEYDGNVDVYVVPAAGGVPKRLTYHPSPDVVIGWTPDGKRILFGSFRDSYAPFFRMFTIGLEGGLPTEVPLPRGAEASYSADGNHLAYVPIFRWQNAWKRYHGGQTTPIWIANLADSSIQKLPRDNSNDSHPMWIGNRIYFLSDRAGPVTLFSYDTASKRINPCFKNTGLDIKSASAGPGAIVYEQFGALHLYDLATGKSNPVPVKLAGDMPQVRPRFVKVLASLHNGRLSPTGARAVFEARGEILTVPAEKGDVRNLTRSPGVADRDPSWSPDGKSIAYFSDESGEYALHIRAQSVIGDVKKIGLGSPPSFFYTPVWSPDSKKIAYADKRLNLSYVDLEKGTPVKVDTDTYDSFGGPIQPAWSPDSKWLTYAKSLKNHLGTIFVYSLETSKATQVTDGMSDARFTDFDRSGKYLFFTASTDIALGIGNGDMTSMQRPMTRSVYVAVLNKELPSPIAPESDEEKAAPPKPAEPAAKPPDKEPAKESTETKIDLENIGQRILALPIPAHNYVSLSTGKAGNVFLLEAALVPITPADFTRLTLHKFDLTTRKTEKLTDGIQDFALSQNGEKMLYHQGPSWAIVSTSGPVKPGDGTLKLADAEAFIDPQAEWKQMYREVWHIERDFFYDPGFHGLDLDAASKKYAPWLDGLTSRADLNYLFEEMLGEMSVGHMFVGGGDSPQATKVRGGLLGADYRIENGRYRFSRVYNGENWNPEMRAPLTQPGVNVTAGEYLLAVNGRSVTAADEVYRFFEGTAGKQTVLKVGPNPDATGAREVTAVPVESEQGLRHLAWIEDNRRKVDQMSGGKLAYVYLPDTAFGGLTSFNRYYFSQTDKQGAVIDERFNGGGYLADYIIEFLKRPIMNMVATRDGADETHPVGAIYGPKAMIINEAAGSGGDWLPWQFRKAGIGPLIGKRTWGGLIGIGGYPDLIDGGSVTAPRWALYGLKGDWEVENVGIPPDIDVDFDPQAWRSGHDPQLEKAVEVVMDALKKNPPQTYKRPPYPNYHKK